MSAQYGVDDVQQNCKCIVKLVLSLQVQEVTIINFLLTIRRDCQEEMVKRINKMNT